ncbi:MAG: C-GCAxxG-C-C family protein [Bacteroidales bacterium]|nr:C-GCAxxG-C-C family protein [Bacteroidales bacterium]
MEQEEIDKRKKRGRELHGKCNCAQSVLLAVNDLIDMSAEEAVQVGAPFGSGISGLRETCGCVTGMALVAAKAVPVADVDDLAAKKKQRELVQDMAAEFKKENGELVCSRLKDAKIMGDKFKSCGDLIASAIDICCKRL